MAVVNAYSENENAAGKEQILIGNDTKKPELKPAEPEPQNDFSEDVKAKEQEIETLKKELEAERAEKRKAEFSQFTDELVKNGSITTAQKSIVMDFMEICHTQGEYEFAEGEEKSTLIRFKDLMKSIKQVEFSEIASNDSVELSNGLTVDFSDGASIASAIEIKKAEYEKQGVVKTSSQILNELKKGIQA